VNKAKSNHSIAWRAIGTSVLGASHERSGLPNQDAMAIVPESSEGLPLVLAISDGHGSAKSFRSDIGSQFAVKIAQTVFAEFLGKLDQFDHLPEDNKPLAIKRHAEELLPVNIVRQWQEAVKDHLNRHPFSEKELARLQEKSGATALKVVQENPSHAYGATLLATAITENFILYLQLGDGDILTVSELDEVRNPISKDQRLMANETTSLCLPEARQDFRIVFQVLSGAPPALIMLSTDGYSNSFRDEAGFHRVGSDILNMIRRDGIKTVAATLESWLNTTSQNGSGDDITVGVIKRLEERDTDAIVLRLRNLEKHVAQLSPPSPDTELRRRLGKLERLMIAAIFVAALSFLFALWSVFRPLSKDSGPSAPANPATIDTTKNKPSSVVSPKQRTTPAQIREANRQREQRRDDSVRAAQAKADSLAQKARQNFVPPQ